MDSINITADVFSRAYSSMRENPNAIFIKEKVQTQENLVDAINNLTINNAGYALNTVTVSGAQGDPTSNPDTVTYTSNGVLGEEY